MAKNWLTDEQRAHPFFGFPFWLGQGYGLGVSVIVDSEKHAWMGPSTNGAYGWFGIFGTSWRNDVAKDMIVLYMVQNSVTLEAVSTDEAVNAQRMRAQMTSGAFQQLVYGAVEG
jgi:CubicO group peptidase (beta-lactamase class C family)